MPSVACYARVSTSDQAEHGYSIEEQINRMKSYCHAMGWTIHKIYSDPGFSGASTDRPALKVMLSDIEAKQVDTVLVYKLDRLSRSQKDALHLIEDVFLGNGVNFVSISENFDTGTPLGRAMVGILAVFAQLEREQIKERMALGREARAAAGKWNGGGKEPVGYDYIPGEGLVINEYEAVYVRRIFRLYLSGMSCNRILQQFDEEGVRHKYGRFSSRRIVDILHNPLYMGIITLNGKSSRGLHEPIIDEETYTKAQELLAANGEVWARNLRSSKSQSLLSGLLFCGRCGAKFYKRRYSNSKIPRYICASRTKHSQDYIKDRSCKNKTWPVPVLDDLILSEVKKLSAEPEALAAMIQTEKPRDPDPLPALKAQAAKLRRQLSKYMDLYSLDEIDIESVKEKIQPLNEQILALQKEIDKQEENGPDTPAVIIRQWSSAADIIDTGTVDDKRDILRSLIDKIIIDGDDITIHWRFS